jgi:hypothetical protein
MSLPPLKVSDYVTAAVPVGATQTANAFANLSLADWELLTRIGTTLAGFLIGTAFLIWKWRREAKRRDSRLPFD